MKEIIKSKLCFIVSLLTLFLITASCEKDLYEHSIQQNSKITLKRVSLKDLESRKNSKIMDAVILLKNQKLKSNAKIAYDSIYDFYYDDEKGIYLENGQKNSYTFPVYRTLSDNKIENLLFNLNDSGEYDVLLVKYDLSNENLSTLTQTQLEQADKEYIGLIIDGRVSMVHSCIEVQSYQLVADESWGTQAPTYHYEWVTVSTYCSWSEGGGGGGADSGNGGTTNNGDSSGTGPHGGNGSGGGSGSGGSSGGYNPSGNSGGILTAVVDNDLSTNFFANLALSAEQDAWLDNHFSLRLEIIDYLENDHTQEDYQEIKNTIDILDDGIINGEPVLVSPNNPIDDMEEYLSCFNTSLGATVTIYADQPKAGSHNLTGPDRVGHTFISIQQGDNIASFGFYPISSLGSVVPNHATILNPLDFLSTPGVFENNQGHGYDVSLSISINSVKLTNLINSVISVAESGPIYNLGHLNCTDVAIAIFEGNTSVDIPSCESPRPYWDGQTPGTLGEVIRNLPLPSGATKNTTGGTAPNNNCN